MMIKIRGDDPSKEKKKLSGGKILIKEYVDYDHIDDGYRPSSKLWGSHYIEWIYDKDNTLLSKKLKENMPGRETSEFISKVHREHPNWL